MAVKNDSEFEKKADFKSLRKRAEEKAIRADKPIKDMSASEMSTLIHELQIHQIELEIQNEELRKSQAEIERFGNCLLSGIWSSIFAAVLPQSIVLLNAFLAGLKMHL